ncbi:helix-turn-helix domain-containing protein [Streptococcus lutetiensis]|uniref:helix-turn-helix domain-containing protein n=1 Tax=Streptococcus lutetiensis TaxID=150055 RepID=UPI001BD9C639|nr:helix-turn-helix transcriptional regulator [Streptococcus lutetiensis]MBT0938949.1 helix-turn-helix domain-containing protein [Streptococcus lutetiensis]
MYFNQRIKKVRANQGMTQEQFGKMLGVSKTTIYEWERGLHYPDDKNLKKLADFMDLTPDELAYNFFDYEVWVDFGEGQTKKLLALFRSKLEAKAYIKFLKEHDLPLSGKLEIKEI